MSTITIELDCTLAPEWVLPAAYDFGPGRSDVWPAVHVQHFTVHDVGETSADVTEGTPVGVGVNWERCDYDWSQPGLVTATVADSNVYAHPGSSWTISARPADGGGSHVAMTWVRRFRRTPRGLIFGSLYALVGRPIFTRYARDTVSNLERQARAARPPQA